MGAGGPDEGGRGGSVGRVVIGELGHWWLSVVWGGLAQYLTDASEPDGGPGRCRPSMTRAHSMTRVGLEPSGTAIGAPYRYFVE